MLIAAIALLIAGLVKEVIGLGLPTSSIGLLGLVMPPAGRGHCWWCRHW